ncbi:Platelet-activating factor acetylhydrolase, isoform II [uncultured archaeon]|nr:Platelet-activating factor acetylhydrolase, isoform II [uncultured archaeon]
MRKQFVISTFLCSLLILCSFSTAVPSAGARSPPDWPDGTFQGTWNNQKDNTSGSLWGILNQGRRATRGTFSCEWNTSGGTDTGTFRGIFYGMMLVGQWDVIGKGKTIRLTGVLQLNETHFSARLIGLGTGLIDIFAVHDASFLPKLTGPYGVGVRIMHLIDLSRLENFTTDPTDVREMMVQLWYPIETSNLGTRTDYMDYQTFQWLKNRSPIPLITIPNDAYLFMRPHGRNETNIAAGMFPVVIFSPGYDGVYQIYTSFIEDLVSHGFVVASINHPYVSGITVFPDGRTVGLADVPTDPVVQSAFFNMSLRTIVGDAKFVLNTITEINETDPDFMGHFDLSRVGMYGHSFGGANTAVCCFEDTRFRAGLTLDGVFYQQFIPGNITVPFLFMFAETHLANDSTIMYLWNHTTNDTFKMSILGSTHYAFTDVGVLLSHLVPLIPPRILSFGSIAPKRMVNITRTYITIFFEVSLKGEPIEKCLNLSSQFDEVQFDYKLG